MVKRPNAGNLHTIAFDMRAAYNPDSPADYGNTEAEFQEVFRCRALFRFLRGGENVIAARLEGRQPVIAQVRATSQTRQVDPDWRMRDIDTGDVYAVRAVSEADGDRRFLDVLAEKGVAA